MSSYTDHMITRTVCCVRSSDINRTAILQTKDKTKTSVVHNTKTWTKTSHSQYSHYFLRGLCVQKFTSTIYVKTTQQQSIRCIISKVLVFPCTYTAHITKACTPSYRETLPILTGLKK